MAADAGTWLNKSLLRLCSDPHSGVQLDPDVIGSLVSYCELAPPLDAKEYLSNMVGVQNCKDILTEYLCRRGVTEADEGNAQGEFMHVYVKPQTDESWSTGNKKMTKNSKRRIVATEHKISSLAVDSCNGRGLGHQGNNGGSKVKKGGKGISLAEAAEGRMLMPRGAPCACQASRHKLVNNCLSCGKIVCEQEGEGPCNYCGALVLQEGSTYAGLEGDSMPISEAEAAAQAFKDRLVEYGRMSSQRTTVIDDQSDYFQIDGNTWMSEEEKQALQRWQQELELAAEAHKEKVVVTIDLLGRKVVTAEDSESDINIKTSILEHKPLDKRSSNGRMMPNPYVLEKPVYLDAKQSDDMRSGIIGTSSNRKCSDLHHAEKFARTGRVQHDGLLASAISSSILQEGHSKSNDAPWKYLNMNESIGHLSFEDEDCLMDSTEHKSVDQQLSSVLDICKPYTDVMPDTGNRFSLSPSILVWKQEERKKLTNNGSKAVSILMPGMVLLKNALSQSEQVQVVKECRDLGVGPGGFYQPNYGTGKKMHLWMMCLGMHWEPASRSYESTRICDNATPPVIPPSFLKMVDTCLGVARHASRDESGRCMIPHMHPDICLVNFYERSGRLGLHQDRDESQESLQNGVPVVSFSLGDSADFVYGVHRDVDFNERVVLESGDVLVFGGPSRMIFHGVLHIHRQTAPSWLIDKTNIHSGRINLTFRQL